MVEIAREKRVGALTVNEPLKSLVALTWEAVFAVPLLALKAFVARLMDRLSKEPGMGSTSDTALELLFIWTGDGTKGLGYVPWPLALVWGLAVPSCVSL